MGQLTSIPNQWMWRKQSSIITGLCTIWRWGPAVWVRAVLEGFNCFIIPFWLRLDQASEGMWTAFILGASCPGPFLVHTIRLCPLWYWGYYTTNNELMWFSSWGFFWRVWGFLRSGNTGANSFILVYSFSFQSSFNTSQYAEIFSFHCYGASGLILPLWKDWNTWDHFCPCSIWFHVTFFELSCFMHLQNLWVTE